MMSKVPIPQVASADELRITQHGDLALLAYADPMVPTPQLEIDSAKLAAMRASELVAYWNEHAAIEDEAPAEVAPAEVPVVAEAVRAEERDREPVLAPAAAPAVATPRKRRHAKKVASRSAKPRGPAPAAVAAVPVAQERTRRARPAPATAAAKPATPHSDLERRFLAIALDVGLSRAEMLLERVREAAKRLRE